MSAIPEHIQRAQVELAELEHKFEKLTNFFITISFGRLDYLERQMLEIQAYAMNTYITALRMRIEYYGVDLT